MRMMLKVVMPTERANEAAKDGSLPRAIEAAVRALKPEASYFTPRDGKRAALFFFDMKDPSQIPVIFEPLFSALNAEVELVPVMNLEELQKGLQEALGTAARAS
jgi:hypothetical protein